MDSEDRQAPGAQTSQNTPPEAPLLGGQRTAASRLQTPGADPNSRSGPRAVTDRGQVSFLVLGASLPEFFPAQHLGVSSGPGLGLILIFKHEKR